MALVQVRHPRNEALEILLNQLTTWLLDFWNRNCTTNNNPHPRLCKEAQQETSAKATYRFHHRPQLIDVQVTWYRYGCNTFMLNETLLHWLVCCRAVGLLPIVGPTGQVVSGNGTGSKGVLHDGAMTRKIKSHKGHLCEAKFRA